MAKFSKERLEGKALEDAFKLLAQRRVLAKTTVRMRNHLGQWVTVPAKGVCKSIERVAVTIRDELKTAGVVLCGADTCVRVGDMDVDRSVDLRLLRGEEGENIICELKMSSTPYRAVKAARVSSEGWLMQVAFGRKPSTYRFGRAASTKVRANRIAFLGVSNGGGVVRWKLEVQDRDGVVETVKPKRVRSRESGSYNRSRSEVAWKKEKAYRTTSLLARAANKLKCRRYRDKNR